jgi:hypothetical protein
MLGGWSCLVRFACHAPMAIAGFGGRGMYDAVKDLAGTGIYDVIPNGRLFLSGMQMYSTWVSMIPKPRHSLGTHTGKKTSLFI